SLPPSLFILPLYYSTDLPHLHSFPTRRSSDLADGDLPLGRSRLERHRHLRQSPLRQAVDHVLDGVLHLRPGRRDRVRHQGRRDRSEEHTSELQSLAYLVCRLLLEKKNYIKCTT